MGVLGWHQGHGATTAAPRPLLLAYRSGAALPGPTIASPQAHTALGSPVGRKPTGKGPTRRQEHFAGTQGRLSTNPLLGGTEFLTKANDIRFREYP